jgi:hypothetical protein
MPEDGTLIFIIFADPVNHDDHKNQRFPILRNPKSDIRNSIPAGLALKFM